MYNLSGSYCYVSALDLAALKQTGAVQCRYDTASHYPYLGDITCVYFFDSQGDEVAHITGISKQVHFYKRKWHEEIKSKYRINPFFQIHLEDIGNTPSNIIRII